MRIQAQNLIKKFGSKKAVDDISLNIEPGKILGLLGPNGAGKSTTIKMLSGQIPPSSGTIIIDNQKYSSVPKSLRGKIGIMPQEVIIWDDLNIKENLYYSATLQALTSAYAKKRVDYLIEALNMQKEVKTLAKNLSGGFKRRLNLAISIIHEPSLIFLDEPTPGIDAQSRRFLMDFIEELGKVEGNSVVLTDHYLDEAEKLSDYVIIVDQGKIIAEGTVPQLKRTYGDGNALFIDLEDSILEDSNVLKKIVADLNKIYSNVHLKKQTITFFCDNPVKGMEDSIQILNNNKTKAINIAMKEPSLEDIFLIITGHDVRE